jgi:outer membrane immunogenic protein
MKKILLASVAAVLLAGAANAADLPRRTAPAPMAPIVAVPLFTWTGFYVGVNAGYGFGNNNNGGDAFAPAGTFTAAGLPATNGTFFSGDGGRNDGFLGGAQIGYNYQFGMFVAGVEADLQYIDLNRNGNGNGGFATFVGTGALPAGFVYNGGVSGLDYFGTVRARLGVAFDRVLVYATGGFAYGGGDNNNSFSYYGSNNNSRGGYAVGGGVEYAFTNNLTAKLEGLYVNLDRNRNDVLGVDGAGRIYTVAGRNNRDNDFGLVRVGVNFKF